MRSVHGSSKGWAKLTTKKRRKSSGMRCYEKRNDNLSSLGYRTYQEYLDSEDWSRIRERHLVDYPVCLLCDFPAQQVHHMSYDFETLLGLKKYRLVQLCSVCHKEIEFAGDKKRYLKDANRVLFEKASQTERGKKWIIWMGYKKDSYRRAKRRRATSK